MVIIRILQPFLCFFFHKDIFIYLFNVLNFYPVSRFLVTPLLVAALLCLVTNIPHCVFPFGRHCGMTAFYTGINMEKACHQQ